MSSPSPDRLRARCGRVFRPAPTPGTPCRPFGRATRRAGRGSDSSFVIRHPSFASLAVLLAALAGCACPFLGPPRGHPLARLRAADARLPEIRFTRLAEYPGGRLYDYMDGAAEGYFKHQFRVLGAADTKWRSTEAKIELYQLASPANAKALFDEKNDGKGKELPAGLASASWEAVELEGMFYRGKYFCQLRIYGNDKQARQLLDTLAAAVDQSLPKE